MRWSETPLRWRIAALVMFFAGVGVVWLTVRWITYDVLPREVAAIFGGLLTALALGFVLGGWEMKRTFAKHQMFLPGDDPATRAVDRLEVAAINRRRMKGWTIAGLVAIPIAVVVIIVTWR